MNCETTQQAAPQLRKISLENWVRLGGDHHQKPARENTINMFPWARLIVLKIKMKQWMKRSNVKYLLS